MKRYCICGLLRYNTIKLRVKIFFILSVPKSNPKVSRLFWVKRNGQFNVIAVAILFRLLGLPEKSLHFLDRKCFVPKKCHRQRNNLCLLEIKNTRVCWKIRQIYLKVVIIKTVSKYFENVLNLPNTRTKVQANCFLPRIQLLFCTTSNDTWLNRTIL